MKVAVITRHAVSNYGSLLQTIATQNVIEKLGFECEIIDYIRTDEQYNRKELTLLKRKPNWYNNIIKRSLYILLRQPETVFAGKKFEKYQHEYLKLSGRYSSIRQLNNNPPIADVYMTGSDQVWGTVANGEYDSSYCLSFVPDDKKKISYAASFGHTEKSEELNDYYKKWLSRYQHISVREDSAVEWIRSLGLDVQQVLDPTLLLSEKDWSPYLKPIKYKNYILIYQLHNDKKLGEYANKVAKKMGLKLIRISISSHQVVREGKFVFSPNIGEFLSYIKNAKCLITDSFHGTAFAINFNTPFVEVLPNNNTETRNISLLKMTQLEDRILKDPNDLTLVEKKIDFSFVNKVINEKRDESLNIMKNMIEE